MFLGFHARSLSDGFLLVNKVPYRLYLLIISRDFPTTSYLSQFLLMRWLCLSSVNN